MQRFNVHTVRGHALLPKAAAMRRGFSLLEIIIVISIMAILTGVAVPVASTIFNSKARRATAEELENLGTAAVEYFRDTESLPSSPADLLVDPGVAGWNGPYLVFKSVDPVRGVAGGEFDAWRNPYVLSPQGVSGLLIASAGSDGVQGTSDDLQLAVDVTPVRRELTLGELAVINQAILQYNAANLPLQPLPTTYASLLSTLVASGLLPTGTAYAADGWGSSYQPDPPGVSPVVRVTSPNL